MPHALHPPAAQSLPPLHSSWVHEDDGEQGGPVEVQGVWRAAPATPPVAEAPPSAALPAPVQRVPVPVLPLPAGPAVLAFDGSPGARRLVADAAALLGGLPALVVCVWWPLDPVAPALRPEHDHAAERAARRRAADGAALAAEAGLDARPLAVAAEPRASLAGALAAVVAEHDASVVVVAERRRAWAGRLLRRSPARELLDALPCPVLVVPAPAVPGGGARGAEAAGAGRA